MLTRSVSIEFLLDWVLTSIDYAGLDREGAFEALTRSALRYDNGRIFDKFQKYFF